MREVGLSDIPLEVLLMPTEVLLEEQHGDVVKAGPWILVRRASAEGFGLVPTRAWRFTSEDELSLTVAQLTGAWA